MRKIETDLARLDDKWQRTADDFKDTLRSEIAEIKTEPIAELKRRLDEGYLRLERFDERLRQVENKIRDLDAGRSVVGWIIKTAVGIGGLVAGYLGAKHL